MHESGRRAFLRQLLAVAAGGALASALPSCGERAVETDAGPEDEPWTYGGVPDTWRRDAPRSWSDTAGIPDMVPAPADLGPPPDAGIIADWVPPLPGDGAPDDDA